MREHEPDVVVVDIRMPPTHTTEGLDAAMEMRREHAFPPEVMREIERELDLDESRLRARIRL